MRRAGLFGVLLLLSLGTVVQAAPFAEVPSNHWAYPACASLAQDGLLGARASTDFSGTPALTRYEFALAALDALSRLRQAAASAPAEATPVSRVHDVVANLGLADRPADRITGLANDIKRLTEEFQDVLRVLDPGFTPSKVEGFPPSSGAATAVPPGESAGLSVLALLSDASVVRAALAPPEPARSEAPAVELPSEPAPAATPVPRLPSRASAPRAARLRAANPAGSFVLGVAGGRLSLRYETGPQPAIMDYFALGAVSEASEHARKPAVDSAGPVAVSSLGVRHVGTAYEYPLTRDLTLSLAYEAIARQGMGLVTLDQTALTTLGVGYALSPSVQLALRYSAVEYQNNLSPGPRVQDRLAETSVSVRF